MAYTSSNVLAGQAFLFNGARYLDSPNSVDFALPQGSVWSIDLRIYIPTATTLATDNAIVCVWKTGSTSWYLGLNSSGGVNWFTYDGSNSFFNTISPSAIPRDTLSHIAVWCIGDGNVRFARDGIASGSTIDRVRASSTANLTVGSVDGAAAILPNGIQIDELRICTGAIDYGTANFTPGGPY